MVQEALDATSDHEWDGDSDFEEQDFPHHNRGRGRKQKEKKKKDWIDVSNESLANIGIP